MFNPKTASVYVCLCVWGGRGSNCSQIDPPEKTTLKNPSLIRVKNAKFSGYCFVVYS